MKNDIRNLYWPGLYNVKFVLNCSGSILVEMNEPIITLPTSDWLSTRNGTQAPIIVLLSKVTGGITTFQLSG